MSTSIYGNNKSCNELHKSHYKVKPHTISRYIALDTCTSEDVNVNQYCCRYTGPVKPTIVTSQWCEAFTQSLTCLEQHNVSLTGDALTDKCLYFFAA